MGSIMFERYQTPTRQSVELSGVHQSRKSGIDKLRNLRSQLLDNRVTSCDTDG